MALTRRVDKPPANPPPPVDRSSWPRPWAQLKYFTFQPAIFPRLLGQVSPDARPGDLVNVFDKQGRPAGAGLYNPRAKIPLRVVCHSPEPVHEAYFEGALRRAVELRRSLFRLDAAAGEPLQRLVHPDDRLGEPGQPRRRWRRRRCTLHLLATQACLWESTTRTTCEC